MRIAAFDDVRSFDEMQLLGLAGGLCCCNPIIQMVQKYILFVKHNLLDMLLFYIIKMLKYCLHTTLIQILINTHCSNLHSVLENVK